MVPSGAGSICSAPESKLNVEIVPDAIVRSGNAERIEYHAEVASHLAKPGAIAWSAYVVDDLGREVSKLGKAESAIDSTGAVFTSELTPSFPDGSYAMYVRAALIAGDDQATAEAFQAFAIVQGVMRELSVTEWYRNTRIATGLVLTPDVAPTLQSTLQQYGSEPRDSRSERSAP